ncbi:phosphoribosylformylglycinamidine synthase subunit PurS [soil metagenome]|nr:phosphoribosylformylglycinamidine synthase subunit PurS [Gemmatimonadota bacterium]MDQ3521551.1 phosphoribosylformylglycinamidine synthase subunit PurS [Gemmatimonadota bacterium]
MTEYRIDVRVVPRAGILDPQGNAVAGALGSLGFDGVSDVHVGRLITLRLLAQSETDARERAEAMCRRLLANPVTEEFDVRVGS